MRKILSKIIIIIFKHLSFFKITIIIIYKLSHNCVMLMTGAMEDLVNGKRATNSQRGSPSPGLVGMPVQQLRSCPWFTLFQTIFTKRSTWYCLTHPGNEVGLGRYPPSTLSFIFAPILVPRGDLSRRAILFPASLARS